MKGLSKLVLVLLTALGMLLLFGNNQGSIASATQSEQYFVLQTPTTSILETFLPLIMKNFPLLLFSDEFNGSELDPLTWEVIWGIPSVDGELTLAAGSTTRAEAQSKIQFQYGVLQTVIQSSNWRPQAQTTDSSFGFEIWTGGNSQCHHGVIMIANGVLGILRPQPDANNNCSGDPLYQAYLPISNWDAVRAGGTIYLTLTWSSGGITLTVNDSGSNIGIASYSGEAEPTIPLEIRLNVDFNEMYIINFVRVYQVP